MEEWWRNEETFKPAEDQTFRKMNGNLMVEKGELPACESPRIFRGSVG